MNYGDLRAKRFNQRLTKTYENFGYISLNAIVSSYFLYRKELDDFKSIKRTDFNLFNTSRRCLSLGRLEQLHKALDKAHKMKKVKCDVA